MAEQKKEPAKKKVFKKNYYLKGIGAVGKGTIVTPEHKKHPKFKESLTE
jgi:hypothetical protein